ncbi:hypothetical protein [Salinivibrio socompensis]|uniref:hypothetical protein n=1 Tax=Salinivibrio socompensis TaxID=1510206 RepID=UPI00046EDDA5|nr:hypothetical protein [Salinivibrio socompensis]
MNKFHFIDYEIEEFSFKQLDELSGGGSGQLVTNTDILTEKVRVSQSDGADRFIIPCTVGYSGYESVGDGELSDSKLFNLSVKVDLLFRAYLGEGDDIDKFVDETLNDPEGLWYIEHMALTSVKSIAEPVLLKAKSAPTYIPPCRPRDVGLAID